MSSCDRYRIQILLYLDGELTGEEGVRFRKHLAVCDHCWKQIEEEQALSNLLHRASPLYSAPEELYNRVAAAASTEQVRGPISVQDLPPNRLLQFSQQPPRKIEHPAFLRKAAVAAVLAITLALTLTPIIVRQKRAKAYLDTAVTIHQSYLDGKLPLEIQSDSDEEVAAWFSGKVPFRTPTSQVLTTNHPAYKLLGGRLVNYRNGHAALVVYQMETEHISLLVAPEQSAASLGGDEVRLGDLTFHYHTMEGLNVIMWSTHGLTYALVSSLHSSPQHSCLVCHQNMVDHDNFQTIQ
jgi:mycothiol system anti-sigma-R factor